MPIAPQKHRARRRLILTGTVLALCAPALPLSIFSIPARAEPLDHSTITRDGSLGTGPIAETATGTGLRFEIGESNGYRPGGPAGINLLHSFADFELAVGDAAEFSAENFTENILVRVPNNRTIIEGRLNTRSVQNMNTDQANLYWLSPQGVIFGETAELNVGGSLSVSTAESLSLSADGQSQTFEARTDGMVPTLAVAQPQAFGFLGNASQRIVFDGSLGLLFLAFAIPRIVDRE